MLPASGQVSQGESAAAGGSTPFVFNALILHKHCRAATCTCSQGLLCKASHQAAPALIQGEPQKRHALQGPTLTMKIHEYSLMKDVAASQLRPRVPQSLWQVSWPRAVVVNSEHCLQGQAGHACVSSQWMSCTPVCPKARGRWAAEAVHVFCATAVTCRAVSRYLLERACSHCPLSCAG